MGCKGRVASSVSAQCQHVRVWNALGPCRCVLLLLVSARSYCRDDLLCPLIDALVLLVSECIPQSHQAKTKHRERTRPTATPSTAPSMPLRPERFRRCSRVRLNAQTLVAALDPPPVSHTTPVNLCAQHAAPSCVARTLAHVQDASMER